MTRHWPLIRALVAGCAALLLTACDGKPDGWAAIDGGLVSSITSKGCPELTGTYRLHPRGDDNGNVMSVAIFTSRLSSQSTAFPWETITISGDAKTALVATFARSATTMAALHASAQAWERKVGMNRIAAENYAVMNSPAGRRLPRFATMSDDEYERYLQKTFAWPTTTVTLRHGVHYSCSGGWLEDLLGVDGVPGQREDGKSVQSYSHSSRLARDKAGHLVAHHIMMVRQTLTLWCGDGCKGIPLGMWKQHGWGRWTADTPAWNGAVPRPWAATVADVILTPKSETVTAVTKMELSAGNFPGRLLPLLPQGVRVGLSSAAGSRYRFTVYADTQGQISELLRNLDRSSIFANPELESIGKNEASRYEAKIVVAEKTRP